MTTALLLLILCATILGVAAGVSDAGRRRRSRVVRALAAEMSMNYSADDRFHLAHRVAALLPCPGAADVQIRDLIYCRDESTYRYVFTAHYTAGVILTKHRLAAVVRFIESQDRDSAGAPVVIVADADQDIPGQYRQLLHDAIVPPPVSRPHQPDAAGLRPA